MSFDDLFRDLFGKDRPNKMLPITTSRLVAAFTRRSGLASVLIVYLSVGDGPRISSSYLAWYTVAYIRVG